MRALRLPMSHAGANASRATPAVCLALASRRRQIPVATKNFELFPQSPLVFHSFGKLISFVVAGRTEAREMLSAVRRWRWDLSANASADPVDRNKLVGEARWVRTTIGRRGQVLNFRMTSTPIRLQGLTAARTLVLRSKSSSLNKTSASVHPRTSLSQNWPPGQ